MTEARWVRVWYLSYWDLALSSMVFWHGWGLYGFWWGVWYGGLWEFYIGAMLARWFFGTLIHG
jgi:hypothetical protein